jgi:NSS family neurotransmitter:Na+ symporter
LNDAPGENPTMAKLREHWGTRFGFIMAAAGSAVGLGNIWKFPYMTGEHGGGAFLLIYLAFVLVIGLSLVMAELVLGRTAQRNPIGAFRILGGGAWPLVGALGILTGFVILSFYIVVAGWTLAYIAFMASGNLATADPGALGAAFGAFIGDSLWPAAYAALFMLFTVGVVLGGVGHGIERMAKSLMPALLVLLLVLIARSVTLPGAGEGLAFFLTPDFSRVTGATFTAAIGQAFFSLSLGMGALITYGSYLERKQPLPGSAASVVALDTSIAILAGFMILPAVFAFGFDPQQGPDLVFITLPAVFASMPGGLFFGLLFFALLAVAALTSAVSLLEVVVAYLIDEWRLSRTVATVGAALVCFLVGLPSALSQGAVDALVIGGRSFLDWMVALTDILLPLGGLFIALFVGWVLGPRAIAAAAAEGQTSFPLARLWLWTLRLIAPLAIAVILLQPLFR